MTKLHLPRNNEILRATHSANAYDIKPFISIALDNDSVIGKIEPHITNGGTEGHKLYDLERVMDIVIAFDNGRGGNIANKHLPMMSMVHQLKVVLRRRYILNKQCKFEGLNPKFAALLAGPSDDSSK